MSAISSAERLDTSSETDQDVTIKTEASGLACFKRLWEFSKFWSRTARKLQTPPLSSEMGKSTESGVWVLGYLRGSSQIRSAVIPAGRESMSCSESKRTDTLALWAKVFSTFCGTEESGVPGVPKNKSLAPIATS